MQKYYDINRKTLSQITRLCCLFVFFSILALVVKPSPYRRLLFLPVLAVSLRLLSLSTGNPTFDYCIGAAYFPYFFAASDYILLTDVQRELRLVQPPQRADELPENAPLSRRIAWATALLSSQRGLGWAHVPRHALPPRPPASTSRGAFVRAQLARAAAAALLFEAANLYTSARIPALYAGGPRLAAQGWAARCLAVWAWVVPVAALSEFGHALNAALSVAAGAATPSDWPPIQGSPALAWSVRNFWGRVWHQGMRRSVSAHGRFVAHRMLRLARGSAASAYMQLYAAFFVSGVAHYLPEYMALRHWGGGALRFFVLQAVAITLEDGVQAASRRLGMAASWKWKAVGYFWVWSWFAFCLPIWQDPLLHAGVFEEVRYSAIKWLLKRRQQV
ncbi:membrane bound O-acyl transferase family-domain-containing protein [Mycena pura]|uniref:Membrane bound O-acyl transferase family-domain-containing protein n=1 Tax=Mycena pura TaxID=153505 RepID=A0AAD6VDP9_9AGAR|nr:membrane bound O-acyl transferase family-domain-containing protein [Mycena pura]